MNFLSELLSNLIIYLTVRRFSISSEKATSIVGGALGLIISVAALIVYLFVLTPSSIEQYHVTTITYSRCYMSDSNKFVILQSDDTKYFIDDILWKGRYNYQDIVDALNNSSEATVWLKGGNSNTIRGISTSVFNIDPTVGVESDNANRRAVLWLAILFFALGAACVITGFIIKPHDPGSSPLK